MIRVWREKPSRQHDSIIDVSMMSRAVPQRQPIADDVIIDIICLRERREKPLQQRHTERDVNDIIVIIDIATHTLRLLTRIIMRMSLDMHNAHY